MSHQSPLSMEFSRQEYWSGLPCPSPGDFPDPEIPSGSSTLQADSLPSESPWPTCQTHHLLGWWDWKPFPGHFSWILSFTLGDSALLRTWPSPGGSRTDITPWSTCGWCPELAFQHKTPYLTLLALSTGTLCSEFLPLGQMGFCFVSVPSSLTPQRPTPQHTPLPKKLWVLLWWIDRGILFPWVTRWREPLPTLLTFYTRKEYASVLLSHSGSRPYLLLQHSLAHPNTQRSFCPSPKWCVPWVPRSVSLSSHSSWILSCIPTSSVHPCAESTHTKCVFLLLRFRHLQPTAWSVPFGYQLGNYCQCMQKHTSSPLWTIPLFCLGILSCWLYCV